MGRENGEDEEGGPGKIYGEEDAERLCGETIFGGRRVSMGKGNKNLETERVLQQGGLLVKIYPSLRGLARKKFGDGAGGRDADDLTQETCLHVLRAKSGIDPEKNYWNLAFTILFNQSVSWRRKSKREFQDGLILDEEEREDDSSIERKALLNDQLREVGRCLDLLNDRQRRVVLGLAQGYSPEEMGKELGVNPNTMKQLIHRARKKIIESMDKELLAEWLKKT